jgi:hypothetical protein
LTARVGKKKCYDIFLSAPFFRDWMEYRFGQ